MVGAACYMTPIGVAFDLMIPPTESALATAPEKAPNELVGEAPASPAGPISGDEQVALEAPPVVEIHPAIQILRFNQRQIQFVFGARRRLGETFRMRTAMPSGLIIVSHPDHVRSLFTAAPELAPTLAPESPLAPIVGRSSVLTALEPRHMRQRKLLLPNFHGEAIEHYSRSIAEAAEREISDWPVGRPFALAPRMQAITLDVIMSGIFGIEGRPRRDTPEYWLRLATKRMVAVSATPAAQVSELMNLFRDEPVGLTRVGLEVLDRPTYAVIARRRAADDLGDRHDILSQLLQARTEDGEELSDGEVRDELLTLVL